jgi:NTP pyrophosphatase (non-canonical NTP hydrolase)
MKKKSLTPCESERRDFIVEFENIQSYVHDNALAHGWWDDPRNDGELIALMHSELSEALEGLRNGYKPSDHIPDFSFVEEELADCIIRIMDFAQARGLRVDEALIAKHLFNIGRPHKHGKKF